ncbi:MAG: FIST C-terminal domain-containing protein [Rhodocyclaceae bacterium]|nr:FIST C-terminal domain-containing protein [Rhodocyclaceae bacterium]MBX3669734.1 FIST C-terminal domain-containing protein [Rhodocyclaceae bacterium]
MHASAFIHAHAGNPDWRVALAQCFAQLRANQAARSTLPGATPFTLGWCYLSDYYADAALPILERLKQEFPGVAWTGTAGMGIFASGVEYVDEPAMALMLAPLPAQSFRLFSGRQPLPAAASDFIAHAALVHADPATPDLQDLLGELAARTASGYLFGGLTSSRQDSLQIAGDLLDGGLSGVAFAPQQGLLSRVTQGCQPVGPNRTVTRCEGNFLFTLDDRPALECLLEDLGLDAAMPKRELLQAMTGTLAGLRAERLDLPVRPGQFGVDWVVRHLVGVDTRQQILAIAEQVEVGTQLSFCRRDPKSALSDLVRIATEIRDELEGDTGRRAVGAIYVSCVGRGGAHFGAPHAELQTVKRALGELPLVGFFASGEIARANLYGYTGVLTVFTAPA